MRNPKRIPKILKRLQKIWEKNPDLRLGQLIENVFPNTPYDYISSNYLEDEEFIKTLEEYYSEPRVFRRFGELRNETH
jgi:uncharacterized protein YihD (DUF1040 family)